MPYYKTQDLATYLAMYRETIGFIDNIMSQNPGCKFIFLGDFNCNIYDINHCYSKLVRQLMNKHHLVSAFDASPDFDLQSSFTRFDKKTNSYTLIDGVLFSDSFKPCIDNVRISNYGDNVNHPNCEKV